MPKKAKTPKTSCVPLRDGVALKGTLTGMAPQPYESDAAQRFVSKQNLGVTELSVDDTIVKGVPKDIGKVGDGLPRHLTVKELSRITGVSKGTIYEFINLEPDFPVVNKGVKKKYMVDPVQFEIWLAARTNKQRHHRMRVPSDLDMQKLFKNKILGSVQ